MMWSQILVGIIAALPLGGHCATPKCKGMVPVYRNPSYCVTDRVEDLLSRMNLTEKAGMMFHMRLFLNANGTFDQGMTGDKGVPRNSTEVLLGEKLINHFDIEGSITNARVAAEFLNQVQQRALDTRLGIPVTVSSNTRHSIVETFNGTSFTTRTFSEWPESIGLAALRSPELIRTHAEIARQEYTAVGIRTALHPHVDLMTEPRWGRISTTFGESAELSVEMLTAWIDGFQGAELGPQSVATVTKRE
jgi:beta-glucosidase